MVKKKNIGIRFALIIIPLLLLGCGDSCDDEKNEIKKEYGKPDSVIEDSDGATTYVYWEHYRLPFLYTFEERGFDYEGGCKVSWKQVVH